MNANVDDDADDECGKNCTSINWTLNRWMTMSTEWPAPSVLDWFKVSKVSDEDDAKNKITFDSTLLRFRSNCEEFEKRLGRDQLTRVELWPLVWSCDKKKNDKDEDADNEEAEDGRPDFGCWMTIGDYESLHPRWRSWKWSCLFRVGLFVAVCVCVSAEPALLVLWGVTLSSCSTERMVRRVAIDMNSWIIIGLKYKNKK